MEDCLFGEYDHVMDSKGRVSLPSRFRKVLPDSVVLAPGLNGQINVFSPEGFKEWKAALFDPEGGYKANNPKHVKARHFFNNNAHTIDIDSAGRVNVPQKLRDMAGLKKDVVVNGDEDHACLWDKQRWDEYIGDFDPAEVFSIDE